MPTAAELRARYHADLPRWEGAMARGHERDERELRDYIDEQDHSHNYVRDLLYSNGFWNLKTWQKEVLDTDAIQYERLGIAVRGQYYKFLFCIPVHERFPKNLQRISFDYYGWVLAQTIAVGWRDHAELMARLGFGQLDRVLNRGITGHRFPWFMIDLVKDWLRADVDLSTEFREVEVTDLGFWDRMLAGWREPDPARFRALLDEAAEFHLAQSHDLVEEGRHVEQFEVEPDQFWLFPVLLLAVLRLREWEGLENPPLDHPLFTVSPLGRLPEMGAVPYPAYALYDQAEARFRGLFPATPSLADLPRLRDEQRAG